MRLAIGRWRCAGGIDLCGAASGEDADIGVGADDGDKAGLGFVERQNAVAVLKEHDALFGDVLRVLETEEWVDDAADGGVVDGAGGEEAIEDAADHVVKAGERDGVAFDGGFEVGAEVARSWLLSGAIGVVPGLLHVEAGEGGLGGAVGAFPVGEDEAFEAEVALEDLVEEIVVFAGPVALDAVVGAHDGERVGDVERDLEGEEVGLAHGAMVEMHVDGVAKGFLIVEGVVFDVADDLVGLDAAGEVADFGAGEEWVFAGVLEVAAVARLAHEVHASADGHVVALVAEFAADDGTVEEGGVGIPGGGEAEDGGKQGGIATVAGGHADTDGGVGEVDVGDVEAGNTRDEAGAAVVRGGDVIAAAEDAPAVAVDELNFLVEGHGLDDEVGALFGRQGGIHPFLGGQRLWGLRLGLEGGGEKQRGSDAPGENSATAWGAV
jgi:hypothetical protein